MATLRLVNTKDSNQFTIKNSSKRLTKGCFNSSCINTLRSEFRPRIGHSSKSAHNSTAEPINIRLLQCVRHFGRHHLMPTKPEQHRPIWDHPSASA
mmetsp:Transcript_83440/g.131816  ORF Transcript_83440/g.131816 Transcript_83440/m.131816 type:complete len:96 (+) Transcript_83440:97-384(+)